jgi:hypothetical protein
MNLDTELEQEKRLEIITTTNFFLHITLSEMLIQAFVAKSSLYIYERGEMIMQEGCQNGDIYFLVSGTVSCRKSLKVETASKESKSVCKKRSKHVQVEYTKVEHGSTFPEIVLPSLLKSKMCDTDDIYYGIKSRLAECGYHTQVCKLVT